MRKIQWLLLALICFSSLLTGRAAEQIWIPGALRPGDTITISVFRVNEFDRTVRIEEDGTFRFPLCGNIQAAGKMPRDIALELTKLLEPQVANPFVDVTVSSWGPRTVYILGEVKGDGQAIELPTNAYMTALQAISITGGFAESADLKNIAVLRRDQIKKIYNRMPVDVGALTALGKGVDDFILLPEDTIVVPKAPPVFITGMVTSPGIFYIDTQRPPKCSEMLVRAGGLIEGADANQVQIFRPLLDNQRQIITVSIRNVESGQFDQDQEIQPGDSILVNSAEKIYVLGEVSTPGPLALQPKQTVTASQAIIMAGGFTQLAKQNDIILIRDKKITLLNLKRFYTNPDNFDNDVQIQNGDVIFVKESLW